ncbi:helix-turn-helix domain-containing protein [Klebsiella pneumoniae]|uniref:helix-turn-helix domain-containing protein n=1 Tax=Klebsiella pneumoniae TaxID=573 RepID=UPI001F36B530|nr:helix-turn-helix domain-containing protein [Klebsiella pneumoniae]
MAKPKYSPETKLAVVNHYLSGKDGEQSTADLFGIERTSVRRWVRAWQFHGAEGLTAKNNHYSDEFKLVVVRAVISDRLTMRARLWLPGLISPQKYLSGAGSTCTTMPERKVFKHTMRTARKMTN